jgi:hypothetical protein
VDRGEVYRTRLKLPLRQLVDRRETRTKFIVILRGPTRGSESDVPFVIASTHGGGSLRPFEVLVGSADGFHHDTVIDCRWVYTLAKSEVQGSVQFVLGPAVMHRIDVALVSGLQMGGASPE